MLVKSFLLKTATFFKLFKYRATSNAVLRTCKSVIVGGNLLVTWYDPA